MSEAESNPADIVVAALYLVSGGTAHVPFSQRYFDVPAVVDGAGTSPAFAPVPDFANGEYCVSVNFAFAGTSDATVWLFTVAELPPFAGRLAGKSVICDFVCVWPLAAAPISAAVCV